MERCWADFDVNWVYTTAFMRWAKLYTFSLVRDALLMFNCVAARCHANAIRMLKQSKLLASGKLTRVREPGVVLSVLESLWFCNGWSRICKIFHITKCQGVISSHVRCQHVEYNISIQPLNVHKFYKILINMVSKQGTWLLVQCFPWK